MAKEDSRLTSDLEKLNRRIQNIKIRIRESEQRTKTLETSAWAALRTRENVRQKRQ